MHEVKNIASVKSVFKKIPAIVSGVLIILMIYSCKTKQVTIFKNIKPVSVKKIFNHTIDNELEYNNLSIKFSTSVNTPEFKKSFNGTLRIRKDSIIWISIRPLLGIELARIQLTKDSVKYINHLNSTFFEGDIKSLEKMFHVDFNYNILQSILTNKLFIYPESENIEDDIKQYRSKTDSGLYVLESLKDRKIKKYIRKDELDKIIDHEIYILPETFKVKKVKIKDYKFRREFNLDYSEFLYIDEKMMPKNVFMDIQEDGKKYNIFLEFAKISKNIDASFNFKIPEKFKRIK